MHAIEALARIDQNGNITLVKPIKLRNKQVRIIILFPDDDDINDKVWLEYAVKNPAFEFLSEPEEDIYSKSDGKPLSK